MAREGPARTRGLNILAALSWVHKQGGRDALIRVFRHLDEEDIAILSGGDGRYGSSLQKTRWYPFALHCRLLRAIDKAFGDGDLMKLDEVGRYMAAHDLPRVFRALVRLGNPGWILEVSTRLWRYYHDRGHWQLERTPVSIICTLHDHAESDIAFCTTFVGWMHEALEMSGATNVEGAHPACASQGAPRCVFTVRWSLPNRTDPTRRSKMNRAP
jgi:hypothetical protein